MRPPWQKKKLTAAFNNACARHDVGYRNFGNGLALQSDQKMKNRIDQRLHDDVLATCNSKSSWAIWAGPAGWRSACEATAKIFRTAVSWEKGGTAFYARQCPEGYLCLFSGTGFSGYRQVWKAGAFDTDLSVTPGPTDFNDRANSVINRTAYVWVLYANKDYVGPSTSVGPERRLNGRAVAGQNTNLKTTKVGGKVSSLSSRYLG